MLENQVFDFQREVTVVGRGKFHINKTGDARPCHASSSGRGCPFGGEDSHYESKKEAQSAYEKAQEGSGLPTFSRTQTESLPSPSKWASPEIKAAQAKVLKAESSFSLGRTGRVAKAKENLRRVQNESYSKSKRVNRGNHQ